MAAAAEEQPFVAAVLARFADDGPRLVWADWLDESSDPADRARADLIRVQCVLARLADDHPRRPALMRAEADLLSRFQHVWAAPLAGLAADVGFRRGLLDTASVDVATLLARGHELLRRAPVRRLRVVDAGRHPTRLANCPHLAHVRELDLSGSELGNGGLNVLLRSPYLHRLTAVDLHFNGLCDGGVKLLAKAATLPRLRSLSLSDNGQITAAGLRYLADSPHRAGLHALDVSGNDVGDAGVTAVANGRLTRLHTFRVRNNHIGDAGAAALAASPLLARMLARDPALDLRQNAVGPPGAKALAASAAMARATALDLSGNYLRDDGLAALAHSPHLVRLRRLAVRQNDIGDAGAFALAASPLMARLAALDVSANRLTRRGADALYHRRRDWRTAVDLSGNLLALGPPARRLPAPGRRV